MSITAHRMNVKMLPDLDDNRPATVVVRHCNAPRMLATAEEYAPDIKPKVESWDDGGMVGSARTPAGPLDVLGVCAYRKR